MKIIIDSNEIVITDKNASAYRKMNHTEINETIAKMYLASYFEVPTDRIPHNLPKDKIETIVNAGIQHEICDCYGKDFYDEA